mmetsp:Transcript_32218/g.47884  ORF Transcript_32218/g.47884 Transcript_32218/m.47884 type:complete len:86 (+) Transcript_32218:1070-1327(+)
MMIQMMMMMIQEWNVKELCCVGGGGGEKHVHFVHWTLLYAFCTLDTYSICCLSFVGCYIVGILVVLMFSLRRRGTTPSVGKTLKS